MSNLKLVLWSGGCDSTLALYEALRVQKIHYLKGKPVPEVRAITVVEPTVPCNVSQARARRNILAAFKKLGLLTRHIEVTISRTGDQPRRGKDGGSIQTQIWLGAATPYLDDTEDLVLGWHDGEFDNVADATAAFTALQRLNGKTGALDFPLGKRSKIDVLDKLERAKLLDLVWYCEGYADDRVLHRLARPCGACRKCIDHQMQRWALGHFHHDMLRKTGLLE